MRHLDAQSISPSVFIRIIFSSNRTSIIFFEQNNTVRRVELALFSTQPIHLIHRLGTKLAE